jgi:hypothetical protein
MPKNVYITFEGTKSSSEKGILRAPTKGGARILVWRKIAQLTRLFRNWKQRYSRPVLRAYTSDLCYMKGNMFTPQNIHRQLECLEAEAWTNH